jgi:PAS domain S-box-containing protein
MPFDRAESPQSLKSVQEQFEFIAAHIPVAIAHVAQEGTERRYRFVNQPYADLYGRVAEEIVGRHPRDVLGAYVYAQASARMDRCVAGETVEFDLDLALWDGPRTVHVVYVPDLDPSGTVRGFLGVITDVSEFRKLQRDLRQLQDA